MIGPARNAARRVPESPSRIDAMKRRCSDARPSTPGETCHGDDELAVFAELGQIVEETIELYVNEGRPLPPATSWRDYANKMQHVA